MSKRKNVTPPAQAEDDEFEFDPGIKLPAVPSTLPEGRPSFAALMGSGEVYDGASLSGDAYTRLDSEEKRQLVGVPFIIEDFDIKDGENGDFSIVKVLTNRNERYSFTDGGMGITQALSQVPEGSQILCKKGLRASDYERNGRPVTTYYLT